MAILVTNHREESLLLNSLKNHASRGDEIIIISSDNVKMRLSRFIFNFFSDGFQDDDYDCIITPIMSKNLQTFVDFLRLGDDNNFIETNYNNIFLDDAHLLGIDKDSLGSLVDAIATFQIQIHNTNVKISAIPTKEMNNIDNKENKLKLNEEFHLDVDIGTQKEKAFEKENKEANFDDEVKTETKTDTLKGNHATEIEDKVLIGLSISNERYKMKLKGDPILQWTQGKFKPNMKSIECRRCGEIFSKETLKRDTGYNYNIHYEKHEIDEFTCECNYPNTVFNDKMKHFKTIHLGLLSCEEQKCLTFFKDVESLEKHIENHHNDNRSKCKLCPFTTRFPHRLKQHMLKVHSDPKEPKEKETPEEERKTNCIPCGRDYSSPKRLYHHNYRIHSDKRGLIACDICGKRTKDLKEHMKTHNPEFRCDQCGKGFRYRSTLEGHIQAIHMGVLFKCRYPTCVKDTPGYREASNRDAHERKTHGVSFNKYKQLNLPMSEITGGH